MSVFPPTLSFGTVTGTNPFITRQWNTLGFLQGMRTREKAMVTFFGSLLLRVDIMSVANYSLYGFCVGSFIAGYIAATFIKPAIGQKPLAVVKPPEPTPTEPPKPIEVSTPQIEESDESDESDSDDDGPEYKLVRMPLLPQCFRLLTRWLFFFFFFFFPSIGLHRSC
jgi:hypothetical protein